MAEKIPAPPPTGVGEIDREHALELKVVREIQAALLAADRVRARALLERLEEFTEAHFLTEQLLMRQHAYPGYAAHQQEHDWLVGELQEISCRLDAESLLHAPREVERLEQWLLAHMATSDQTLGAFIAEAGGTPAPQD